MSLGFFDRGIFKYNLTAFPAAGDPGKLDLDSAESRKHGLQNFSVLKSILYENPYS